MPLVLKQYRPDVRTILEASVMYRANVNSAAEHIGTLTSRFKVYESKRLKNEIEVCIDLGDERHIAIVTILDMNII